MRPTQPRIPWLALAASAGLLACSEGGYAVVVRFSPPTLAASVERVEVSLVASCTEQGRAGEPAVRARQTIEVTRGTAGAVLGDTPPGAYGLYARGFSATCNVVAAGCAPVTLVAGGEGELVVTVAAVTGPGCGPGTICTAAVCRSLDAGMDARVLDSGSLDAARPDAPIADAGTDAPPACTCAACATCDMTGSCIPDHMRCGMGEYCDPIAGCLPGTPCTAGGTCADDGNPCTNIDCVAGLCVPSPVLDMTACTTMSARGQCWGGACCTGCWNGGACQPGSDLAVCGAGGARCAACDDGNGCTTDSCTAGSCVMTPADGTSCPGGTCHASACCSGCWTGSTCEPGTSDAVCGSGGRACSSCTLAAACPPMACLSSACAVRGATRVAARSEYNFAIGTDGSLWSWGTEALGRLGIGDGMSHALPTRVGVASTWAEIAAGYQHACGTQTDGSLWCWGDNSSGQLGTGGASQTRPTRVGTDTDWTVVAAGTAHTCALKRDASLWCWGGNGRGALGLDDRIPRPTPTSLDETGWTFVATRTDHTCGIKTDGSLWCWGANDRGELGQGTTGGEQLSPTRVGSATSWATVAAGGATTAAQGFTCATRTGGTLWCWGENAVGELGLGDTMDRNVPTQVGTEINWRSTSLGSHHGCGLRTTGLLQCWGQGLAGELGIGSRTITGTPSTVSGAPDWAAVSAGRFHSCGIRMDQSIWCWGENPGLGTGGGTSLSPARTCL